ncbi:uncharacterized protein Z518_06466 [Rhinocladiella mackenziei CBS 650.93]|uniref:L-ornithine N(5)-oxygenase n=1 Tax=Rhinocladiella mackenziei CBS 650.93 TaxID=1442369 RepID=A0A0D2IIM8_9EURO|nr:uncharacterized protein Z518_06466 [Rhinocladiella mackenziei CBS 650.93]KIX05594.1 hypothetical protein Z518_06466 [Rhinocladiella mackenziei CBS 650.93]
MASRVLGELLNGNINGYEKHYDAPQHRGDGDLEYMHGSKSEAYYIDHEHIHKRQKMRLICIGAGIAGIAAAYKYMEQLRDVEFQIYEKNHDVGGTWLENRYPGCACDIPAHGYTYSWEGNPNWSRFYAEAEEIHSYYKGLAIKWNCMQYIKLSHRVIEAKWSEAESSWNLKIESLTEGTIIEDRCDILLSATGVLNHWKWPDIPGLHRFKGRLLHSARWDEEYNFQDKTVAVIGAGSSAIQIVPNLQKGDFIRSPTWITPEFSASLAADGRETRYSAEEIKRFNTDKKYFLQYRKDIQNTGSSSFSLYYKGSELQEKAYRDFSQLMRKRLGGDAELCERLIPKFEVGCRRFTPGNGFLEALVKPNVTVVVTEIESITPDGIRTTDGVHYDVDAIVCATGFDCSYRPAFPVIGRDGRDLGEFWRDEPVHYLSVAVPGFPNYFVTGGPNSPISNGSLISGLETEIDYAYACLRKLQEENGASMEASEQATADFMEHKNAAMKEFVWSGDCKSWYKNGRVDGPVIGPWCGSTWHFNKALRNPRFEDYIFKYRKRNRFQYLGFGRTLGELRGEDMAAHLREPGA